MLPGEKSPRSTTPPMLQVTFEPFEATTYAKEDQIPPQFSYTERRSSSLQDNLTQTQSPLPPSCFTRPNSITIYRKRLFQREPSSQHCQPEPLLSQSAPARMGIARHLSSLLDRLKPRTSSPLAETWIKEQLANNLDSEFANRITPERTRWEEVERHVDWQYYTSEEASRESHDWENESDWRSHGSCRRSLEGNSDERPRATFYLKNYDWSRGDKVEDGDWEEPRAEFWESIEFLWQKDGLITSKTVPRPYYDVENYFD